MAKDDDPRMSSMKVSPRIRYNTIGGVNGEATMGMRGHNSS